MAETSSPKINSILSKKSPIANLYKKGLYLKSLDNKLKNCLEPDLQDHFELANINKNTVILIADSSAWATRLRYSIPDILKIFNDQLDQQNIKTIRIKIKKTLSNSVNSTYKPPVLSKSTAKFLNDTANSFNDTELKQCIKKLSRNKPEI